jgi:hypothetical protein
LRRDQLVQVRLCRRVGAGLSGKEVE